MKTKEGLENEYKKYVANNDDPYSKQVVEAGEKISRCLDAGDSAEKALDAMHGLGLTGFMASMAAKAVAHFHPRGEEVRVAWNALNGIKTDAGIVNAAVLNVEEDGRMTPEIEGV